MENQTKQEACKCGTKCKCQCGETCQCGTKCKCGKTCYCCNTGQCNTKNICWTCILLIVIAVLLTSAITVYFMKEKNNDITPTVNTKPTVNQDIDKPIVEEPTINEPTDETDEQIDNPPLNDAPTAIFYNNNDYGFALTLPSSWTGYITNERTLSWGDPVGDDNSIDFGFTAQDSIFNISIFTLEQWADLQNIEGPLPGYLGENSQYVFAYDISQFTANAEMSARRTEVSGIISTFRIIP